MRVGPPTKMILSMPLASMLASCRAWSTGPLHFSMTGRISLSSSERVKSISKWRGSPPTTAKNGRLTWVVVVDVSSILATSAASRSLAEAFLSVDISNPVSLLNFSEKYWKMAVSISVPPSWVSPLVDLTSKTPLPKSIIVTSRVPPPRSITTIFMSWPNLSSPYARDAAVGSFTRRATSRPAIPHASLVALLWLSSK